MPLSQPVRASAALREALAVVLANAGVDPQVQPQACREVLRQALGEREEWVSLDEQGQRCLERVLLDDFVGLGPLQPFLDDPEVEEIWIDSPTRVFVARGGRPELTTVMLTDSDVSDLVERMLRSSGRRLDRSSPFVDATLAGGERLHAVIPPITRRHWSVNIRKHVARAQRVSDLVTLGMCPPAAAVFLPGGVVAGLICLVTGATQAGNTTVLRALCGAIPTFERIITCEEVFELDLAARDVVAMQTRPATLEGTGEIALRDLVKETLRMRPDRIIVGEVRGAESLDMLIAMNAGVAAMSTLHANSARDGLNKLTVLPLLAGPNVSADFVVPTLAHSLDLVIHVEKAVDGRRRIAQISAVSGRSEGMSVEAADLYRLDGGVLTRTAASFDAHERFARSGLDLESLLAA